MTVMATQKSPTPTQRQAIRYFNGDVAAAAGRSSAATYKACERNGWIEEIDVWPYHQATRAGAEAVGMEYSPKVPPAND
jgi:hypothetical protein